MRISDWSSDVCSSDLAWIRYGLPAGLHAENPERFPADLYRILKQADRSRQWALWQWPGSPVPWGASVDRSEEHTSELQSLMRISYAVFCLKKKKTTMKIKYHQSTSRSTIYTDIHVHTVTCHQYI